MTQKVIKIKLAAYLKFKSEQLKSSLMETMSESEEREKAVEALEKYVEEVQKLLLEKGRCFAFSKAEAAYSANGYGRWWQEILVNIVNCDPTCSSALSKVLDLTPHLPSSHQDNNDMKAVTVDHLYERVLNHVLAEFAEIEGPIGPFMLLKDSQLRNLMPGGPFELAINQNIYRIKGRACLSGHFSSRFLVNWLNKNKDWFVNNLCLIHGNLHAANIKWENDKWIFYEPNYSHESVTTMTKSFSKTEDLVAEIKERMRTRSLTFQIASFHSQALVPEFFYEKLSPAQLKKMTLGEGMQMMARYYPSALSKIFPLVKEDANFSNTLSRSLICKNRAQWSGLHVLAKYASNQLKELLLLSDENPALINAIATALIQVNKKKWTPLHMMICYAPDCLPSLLDLAEKHEKIGRALHLASDIASSDGLTGMDMLNTHRPVHLLKLLQIKDKFEHDIKIASTSTNGLFSKKNAVDTKEPVYIKPVPIRS